MKKHLGWAIHYNACISCKTTNSPHNSKGLCCNCYGKLPRVKKLKKLWEKSKKGRLSDKRYYELNKDKIKAYGKQYRTNPAFKMRQKVYSQKYWRGLSLTKKKKVIACINLSREKIRYNHVQKIIEYLKKHPCVDCGEKDILVLHFDHSHGNKSFGISDNLSLKWSKVLKEIQKCSVVCANCHMRRTAKQQKWIRFKLISNEISL